MAKKTDDTFDYSAKTAALDKVLASLQDPDIQLDTATKLHAEGMKLVAELEAYLKSAENTIQTHTTEG